MPGLGLAPYILLLLALSAHSARRIIRCDDIPIGVSKFTTLQSSQICAAGNNWDYLEDIIVHCNDSYNGGGSSTTARFALSDVISGRAAEYSPLSCVLLPNSTFELHNNNAKKDCSDDFFIYMEDERVTAIAVPKYEEDAPPLRIIYGSTLLFLSSTGRMRLKFLQGKENVASIRAGSNSGSRTIYNVNYEHSTTYPTTPTPHESTTTASESTIGSTAIESTIGSTAPESTIGSTAPESTIGSTAPESSTGSAGPTTSVGPTITTATPRTPEVEVPDTYVLFDSIIQIVPWNEEPFNFTISRSTDIIDYLIVSPGSFVVVGTSAFPDSRHLNGQDNRAVFRIKGSLQIDTLSNYCFDARYGGSAEIVAGGLWFNGTREFSGYYNVTDEFFSYYGDSLEMRYLTIVPPHSQSYPNDDYFATEVRVRELPPDVTPPPAPSQATTQQSAGPTGFPSEDGKYCACRYDHLWLDVVFLVEATDSMGKEGIDDVIAFIQGALYQMSKGDRRFSSRAGIIAYGVDAQVIARFSDLLTDDNVDDISIPFLGGKETNIESAIRQANDMISQASGSRRARKVIVLVATAFRAGSYDDPHQIAEGFRESGGTIITIDYIEKDGIVDPKLTSLATPTFAYNNTNGVYTFGDDDLLKAFCDINCFCSTNQRGFEMPELVSRPGLPTGGCYEIVTLAAVERAARIDCRRKNASLPSIHTEHKQRYLTSLFPPKTQHWIGLEREGASYAWIDYTPYDYSNWPKDADIGTGPSFYSWQYSGFRTGWFSAPTTKSAQYTCQFAPCDSLNDACLVEEP